MKDRDETSILDVKSVMLDFRDNTTKLSVLVQNPPKKYTAHFLRVVYVCVNLVVLEAFN